jgi:hypothetical protein
MKFSKANLLMAFSISVVAMLIVELKITDGFPNTSRFMSLIYPKERNLSEMLLRLCLQ